MTTLNINGKRIKVDDSFRNLSPEDQERTVNEIAAQMGIGEQQGDAPVMPREQAMPSATEASTPQSVDDYYSSGIFAGEYNPLGAIARSLDAATTAGGDAITFGWGDEAAGLMGMDRGAIRGRQAELRGGNPIASTVGAIGGGLALAGPMRGGLSGLASNSGLGMRVLAGAAEGMGLGGLYGAGSADDSSRLMGAAKGGAIGGAAGAAFPLIAAGAGKVYETARNAFRASPIAEQAGTTPEAARVLSGILQADDSLGPTGRANMAMAGQEAMLADAGPTAAGVLDTAIQRGGQGATIARQAIDDRVGRDSAALVQALDNTLGQPQGIAAAQNASRQAARPQVSAAYDRAYNTPIDYASEAGRKVEDIINRIPDRIAGRAVRDAVDRMVYDGVPNAQIMANIADDGAVTFQGMPNVMQADYIKRALNNIVEDGTDAVTGKLSSDAVFASRMARDLRDAVADAVPAYSEALRTAADPLSEQAAIRLGGKMLSTSMPRDQAAIALQGMTGPEKKAVAQGIRSQIDDAMANVKMVATDHNIDAREAVNALKSLSSRANREKVGMVLGEREANSLFDELDRVSRSFGLRADVATNSRTFGRGEIAGRVRDTSGADSALRTIQMGEPVNATKRIVQALTGETPAKQIAREDEIFAEIARLLTKQGGAGADVYNAINQIGQTDAATALMRDRIAKLLSGPQTSYPVATQSQGRL